MSAIEPPPVTTFIGAAHLTPRPLQDAPAEALVMKHVEPSPGIGLGRPVSIAVAGGRSSYGRLVGPRKSPISTFTSHAFSVSRTRRLAFAGESA